jgi:hypothetical protein
MLADKSLEVRLSAVEAQLGGKTLQEHFREQAELIDRLFVYRFEDLDKRWDAKLEPMRSDLAIVKDAVKMILTRLR